MFDQFYGGCLSWCNTKGDFCLRVKIQLSKKKNVTKFWYVGGLRLDYFLAMISSFLESQLFVWQQLIAEAHLCTHVVQDWKDSHEWFAQKVSRNTMGRSKYLVFVRNSYIILHRQWMKWWFEMTAFHEMTDIGFIIFTFTGPCSCSDY